jgi:hypothetical protein
VCAGSARLAEESREVVAQPVPVGYAQVGGMVLIDIAENMVKSRTLGSFEGCVVP